MSTLAPNTPVIIGIGFCQIKSDNPLDCPEASDLMIDAIRAAAKDAGSEQIVGQLQSIGIQKGSWAYKNPGLLIKQALGCNDAKTIMADLGVLQLMPYMELCQSIVDGDTDIGVVTGGESRFRDLRSMITGVEVHKTEQGDDTPEVDVFYATPDAFCCDLEAERGVWAPGEFYAIADSAVRHSLDREPQEHRQKLAQMYSDFSKTAAQNPHAWNSEVLSPEELLSPDNKNEMIAYPFSKKMMSQWNVNQSVAVIVCSYQKAQSLGLDASNWIYPTVSVQHRYVVSLAQKTRLDSHIGTKMVGKRAFELAKLSPQDIDVAELYSCFPSAIISCARDLELEGVCPINVTGTMALAGGPFNHGAVDSLARMVEVLREKKSTSTESAHGLVTAISGMFGKHAVAILNNQPNPDNYVFDDVTDAVKDNEQTLEIDATYTGPATIVAYSVMYNKGAISHGIAYCDIPEAKRTIVRTNDLALAEKMTQEEFIGRAIAVKEGGDFELA